MKQSAKAFHPQMKLPLLTVTATAALPDEQQSQLTIALMELLISAAGIENEEAGNGGEDEPETYA